MAAVGLLVERKTMHVVAHLTVVELPVKRSLHCRALLQRPLLTAEFPPPS
jgi:hypothetical protein